MITTVGYFGRECVGTGQERQSLGDIADKIIGTRGENAGTSTILRFQFIQIVEQSSSAHTLLFVSVLSIDDIEC